MIPLEAFIDVPLKTPTKALQAKLGGRITVTEEAMMPTTHSWFPLLDQAHYENRTLRGLSTALIESGGDIGAADEASGYCPLGADLVSPEDDDLFGADTDSDSSLFDVA